MADAASVLRDIRQGYLDALNFEALNSRLGGPLFLFALVATSMILFGSLVLSGGYGIFQFPSDLKDIDREDFAAFYRAGMMAAEGIPALAYDPAIFAEPFSETNKYLLFLNPPHAFLFFEPLSWLPYPLAKGLGLVLNLSAILATVYLVRLKLGAFPYAAMLLSCGFFASIILLQISPVITFLLVFALTQSRAHPWWTGAALAAATLKPQYGLLVPVFLLAVRDWRAIAAASLGTLALVLASIFVYGWPVWEAFFRSLGEGAHSAQFMAAHPMMITFAHSFGKLGGPDGLRIVTQAAVSMACAVFVWRIASTWPRERALPLVLLAMSLAAPSFMFYDWQMLCVALLFYVRLVPVWPLTFQVGASVLWLAPFVHDSLYAYSPDAARVISTALPFLIASVMTAMWAELRRIEAERRSGRAARSDPLPQSG